MLDNVPWSSSASGGSLHGGASLKVEKANLLHEEEGNEKSARSFLHKVFLRPPQVMDVHAFGSQRTLFPALRAMG